VVVYERELRKGLDYGFAEGYSVGIDAGKELAYDRGLADEYNRRFNQASREFFRAAFTGTFIDSYNVAYEDLRGSSRLENLDIKGASGEINDGIVTPGERVKVSYVLRNVGGKETRVKVTANDADAGSHKVNALTETLVE